MHDMVQLSKTIDTSFDYFLISFGFGNHFYGVQGLGKKSNQQHVALLKIIHHFHF